VELLLHILLLGIAAMLLLVYIVVSVVVLDVIQKQDVLHGLLGWVVTDIVMQLQMNVLLLNLVLTKYADNVINYYEKKTIKICSTH
jgi:hypothetical protein